MADEPMPNVYDLPCKRCGGETTHERGADRRMHCIRCRVLETEFATRPAYTESRRPFVSWSFFGEMDIVRAIGTFLILSIALGACLSAIACRADSEDKRADRPSMEGPSAKPIEVEAPVATNPLPPAKPNISLSSDRSVSVTAAKKKRAAERELAAANAVIGWCNWTGKIPLWNVPGIEIEATFIDDRKGNLVNVSVDHPDKEQVLQGHTLWYQVKFKGNRPATITANKEMSALACRELEADIPAPLMATKRQ